MIHTRQEKVCEAVFSIIQDKRKYAKRTFFRICRDYDYTTELSGLMGTSDTTESSDSMGLNDLMRASDLMRTSDMTGYNYITE